MTRIGDAGKLTRETAQLYRGDPLVVTLFARYIEVHPKGTRGQVERITYEAIYEHAIRRRAEVARLMRPAKAARR